MIRSVQSCVSGEAAVCSDACRMHRHKRQRFCSITVSCGGEHIVNTCIDQQHQSCKLHHERRCGHLFPTRLRYVCLGAYGRRLETVNIYFNIVIYAV